MHFENINLCFVNILANNLSREGGLTTVTAINAPTSLAIQRQPISDQVELLFIQQTFYPEARYTFFCLLVVSGLI